MSVPAATPVTKPAATVAVELLHVQVPGVDASVSNTCAVLHTLAGPDIGLMPMMFSIVLVITTGLSSKKMPA